jgi:hypothetical protein
MKDLLDHLFVRTDLSPNFHAYDKSNSGSVYAVAKAELQNKFKLSEEEANKAVDWMVSKLKRVKCRCYMCQNLLCKVNSHGCT